MWNGVAAENNPCPCGFRIPTNAEWNQERLTWSSNTADGAFESVLKLPRAGYRSHSDGKLENSGIDGNYWSASTFDTYARYLYIGNSNAIMLSNFRAIGHSIRCIKY